MSYLSPLRLHFAGRFQANVSTVNNDPLHFDNASFLPEYQEPQTDSEANGWFNPRGTADWRLLGCRVTTVWLSDGSAASETDPIRTSVIADGEGRAPAKLVDLDSQQQLVSQIWGLEVRICDAKGVTYLRGQFEPAAFMDIWNRGRGGGDSGAGAMFQSVLTDLEWGYVTDSPFLQQLQTWSPDRLSIKFNVDGFNLSSASPTFMTGRIVGTIGPATVDEPRHFVRGRQLMATPAVVGGFFVPAGGINSCVADIDPARNKIFVDLGNALRTRPSGGPVSDIGPLNLGYYVLTETGPEFKLIDTINYTEDRWYEKTAGIVELPAGRQLTAAEVDGVRQNPLACQRVAADGSSVFAIAEPPTGVYIRADRFVHRLSPDESVSVSLYATRFGEAYPNARILVMFDPSRLQGSPNPDDPLPVSVPATGIEFPTRLVADASGIATLPITARNPGNPRGFIDGQVYGLRPVLEETIVYNLVSGMTDAYPFKKWDFISLLVWDRFEPDDPPTWHGSMQPILQQYANLYPYMANFLDLGEYASVCAHRERLIFAFDQPETSPNVMPVTRDLSTEKRKAILRWLREIGPDGNPLLGTPPPSPRVAVAPAAAIRVQAVAPPNLDPSQGGKAAAIRRAGSLRSFGLEGVELP